MRGPEIRRFALATSPAMADNPSVAGLYQNGLRYQMRLDSMTIGPWRASADNNPDLVQLRALAKTNQDQLVEAVASQVQTLDARIKVPDRPAEPHRRLDPDSAGHGGRGNAAESPGRCPGGHG